MPATVLPQLRRSMRPILMASLAVGCLLFSFVYPSDRVLAFGLAAGAGAVLSSWRPRLGGWALWALILGAGAWTALEIPSRPYFVLETGLPFLSILVLGALLLDGPAAGWTAAAFSLANLAWAAYDTPEIPRPTLHLLSNLALSTVAFLGLGLLTLRSFGLILRGVEDRHRQLAEGLGQVRGLAQALFLELEPQIPRLEARLRDWPAGAPEAEARCLEIHAGLQSARDRLSVGAGPALSAAADWEGFRRRIFVRFLALLQFLGGVDLWLTERSHGPLASSIAVNAVMLAVLLAHLMRPQWSIPLRRVFILAVLAGLSSAILWWGPGRISPTLHLLPGLAFFGAVFDGMASAGAVVVAALTFTAYEAGHGAFDGPAGAADALSLILLQVAVLGGVATATYFTRTLMEQLEEEEAALRRALRRRQRLASTLFHDVRNPLSALATLLGLQSGGAGQEGDQERALLLAARLRGLVAWARRLHESEDQMLEGPGAACAFGELVEGLRQNFSPSLQAKGLRLTLAEGGDLPLPGEPELLRDVLLGNLLSNALKFSPPGADITLGARRTDGQVRLWMRDQGSGFAGGILESLAQGRPVESRRGTRGEQGFGLGLSLVRDYLEQMGGSLELSNPQGGGAMIALVLPRP